MIEVVTETDLNRLGAILPHAPNAKLRAATILTEIIDRLPRPRAYISEPTHMPDEAQAMLWNTAYDMLSAELSGKGISVIEPETIRDIALFSSTLETLTDASDPLWQALIASRRVDSLYVPSDGENSKRHAAMRRIARSAGITVLNYRPQYVRERRIFGPPTR